MAGNQVRESRGSAARSALLCRVGRHTPARACPAVAHARMEQQLYGSSSRGREEEQRVITGKQRSLGPFSSGGAGPSGSGGAGGGSGRGRSEDADLRRGSKGGAGERQGLRGLFFNILRSRFDSSAGGGGGMNAGVAEAFGVGSESPKSLESQLVRREGSMHLPRPADCNMPGTHSGEWSAGGPGCKGARSLVLGTARLLHSARRQV
jgi:hypothetical protein